jgi:hypothetical protein
VKEALVSETTVSPAASPQQQNVRQTSAFQALASDRSFFQTKLRVGSPNDPLEKEADDMAARVVQKPENSFVQRKCADCEEKEKVQRKSLADGVTPFVQRKLDVGRTLQRKGNEEEKPVQTKLLQRKGEEEEEPAQAKDIQRKESEEEEPLQTKLIQRKETEEEEEPVQTKLLSEGGFSTSAIDGPLQDSKGKGSRLSASVLRDMEAGFGVDLGEVRIHTDHASVAMNQAVHAQAFTNGWDIYFNQHRFDPGTNEGKFLLAHELTHTIQQAKANGETLKPALSRAEPEKPAVANEAQAIESAKLQSVEEAAELTAKSSLPPKESSTEKNLPKSLPKKAESKKSPTLPTCKPPAKKKGDTVEPAKPHAEATDTKTQSPSVASPPTGETKPSIVAQAPKCPANDPAFKKAKSIVKRDAKKQADHEPANKKRTEMVASAALPMAEQNVQSGQEQQAANLEKAASPRPFDRFQFKEKLKLTIASKMPKTEDQAKAFAGSSKLTEAKEEFKGTISEEKGKISGPLEQTAKLPLPAGKDLKPDNIPIPEPKPGDKPSQVPTGLPAPKPRTDAEISLDHKSVELDNQMTREGLTEKQLADSEEPKFEQALQSKKDAQREIAAAPDRYRQIEGQQLEKTSKEADKKTKRELSTMSSTKSEKNREVFGGQTAKETQTEQRQKDIKDQIDGIYNQTKTEVEKILADLSSTVEATFSREVDQANETFKANVRSRLDDHYGFFTFDDKIAEWAGLSAGVKHIFLEEKELFLYTMDLVLDDIASTVETELSNALQRIQLGRTELENFKKTLSTDELKFAEDLFLEAGDKFNELESSVHESQDDLIESLSDAYVENVSKLQEEFDKIDEELSASWIADAISFIGEVATAIKKLGQLLSSIASRIGQYISDILASPKRFFNNLVDGIKGGMDEFRDNIDTYLERGFWMWLTGASGGTNIQIPKKMDAEGMFSLATQILGLTKEFVLERIKTVLRIPVDAFLALVDKAKEIGGKVLEPVKILINQGIGALWVWVKDEVSGHLTEIFDKLKVEIFQAIIKKFLLWVASLFIPGLGFIKLIQAAYKALRWLVDNIDRIVEIVNTFLDAVGLAVAGNVSSIKGKVVKALTNGVVIAIDFLAKLVGLGNFSDKLQRGIEMLRKPVRKVIDMILIKAKPIVRKIQKAIAKGVAKVKRGLKKGKDWAVGKAKGLTQAGLPKDPQLRLEMGMNKAVSMVNRLPGNFIGKALIMPTLTTIKVRYGFQKLEPKLEGGFWQLEGQINPSLTVKSVKKGNTNEDIKFTVGSYIKAMYHEGMWVAQITTISEKNVTIKYEDKRKGREIIERGAFVKYVKDGLITEYDYDKTNRQKYLGSNISRSELLLRYRNEGTFYRKIGSTEQIQYPMQKFGKWYNIDSCDASHEPTDAVTYWNRIGYKHGPLSTQVRAWMTNPKNYIFEPASLNRSRGSRKGQTYRAPVKP